MATKTLSVAEQRILDLLSHQALTVHQVADRLGMDPQHARRTCAALRERGLLAFDITSTRYSRAEVA